MKYIFFDIDNTIYSVKNNTIRPSIIALFTKLHANGYKLGVATGRNNSNLEILSPIIQYIDYFVLSNGMYVRDKEKVIYQNNINKELFDVIYQRALNNGSYLGLGGPTWRFFLDRKPFFVKKDLVVDTLKNIDFTTLDTIWLVNENQDIIDKDITYLKTSNKFSVYRWNNYGADIVLAGHGKETGVSKILTSSKDPCELLVTVGDGDNDLKLMQMATWGIAMTTTKSQALLATAKYHISSVETDELYNLFLKLGFIS